MTATIHKVVAGNGYQYYLRNVAAYDTETRGRSGLADYYSAEGESPGQWYGTGLSALGITAGDDVSEEQMKALFGLGRHPNADRIEDQVYGEQIHLGGKHKDASRAAEKASRLGHPFRIFSDVSTFRRRCAQAFEEHNSERGFDAHDPIPEADRSRIRTHIAFDMFVEQYRRAPFDARELSGWVAKNSRPDNTAVAGFDITFSPVKSVSALWALAPRAVSADIEVAHRRAIEDAMRWLEQHAICTRLGRNGIRHVDVEGTVAAWFTHRDSRAGDPDLHTHVLIANRVRTMDGRWRTVYGADLYRAVVTASEIYNTRLEHHLEHLTGAQFAPRPDTEHTPRPIREIVGIPVQLIQSWSRRDADISHRLEQLTAQFQRELGREPIPTEVYALAERATLETRPSAHHHRSLAEQRSSWRAQAMQILGHRDGPERVVAAALASTPGPRARPSAAWISNLAGQVLDVVSAQRSTWRYTNVRAEVDRQIRGRIGRDDWDWVTEAVASEALSPTRSVRRGDPDAADEPEVATIPALLRRRSGASMYTESAQQLYTSAQMLSVEQQLIELATAPGGRQLTSSAVADAVDNYNRNHPDKALNAGQAGVVFGFATSGLRVHTANAPAGSGKTTAMQVLTEAWHTSGGTVLGVAPTASAAASLGEAIGARVETVDKVLDVLTKHTPALHNPALERDVPPSLPQWVLDIDGDTLVIVDEHVKVGNAKRLRLLQFLTARNATVRCIGDDRQLPAIDAGGADADMAAAAPEPTMTLTHIVRFASAGEASASVQLRDGDPAALGWYLDNGRVHGGHYGATHDDTYIAWAVDDLAGRDTLMLAATHEVVTALNARARSERVTRRGHNVEAEVVLVDGLSASAGDTIRTRRNDPRLRLGARDWVRNGYAWTVDQVHDNADITVTHLAPDGEHGMSVRLPADYVSAHVRLGYATTIDAAQGITTDTCHVALTGFESRQQLYVALTRGKHANHLYVPTALDGSEGSLWTEAAAFPRTAVEVLVRIFDRDGAQRSAHTELRDALDPHRRIGRALDIYLDMIGLAAEDTLGTDGLERLDIAADTVRPNLTDCPAYPVLRQHLALLALTSDDPIEELRAAAAIRELDTAHDAAAVLDWRLGPVATSPGPVPWAPGLPHGLDEHPLANQLGGRRRIVADLADHIRASSHHWTPMTAPHWARPLIGIDPQLVADIAVWRAALHTGDRDVRPTGPPRYSAAEREYQHDLEARLTASLGDPQLPINTWTPTVHQLDNKVTADPHWPAIADKIYLAHRAGIDITTLLTHAAAEAPLPNDMPAAALWSRLGLDPTTLENTRSGHELRPPWLPELQQILGNTTTQRIQQDPAWPQLVVALDRATGTDWTPSQLVETAHELLVSAQPTEAPPLRPDQLTSALVWRIDALLGHLPTPTPPQPTDVATHTQAHHREQEPPMDPDPTKDPLPATTPPLPIAAEENADLPETIRNIAALFQSGHITDATATFQAASDTSTADQRWVLAAVADTLYQHYYPIALTRLRWAAQQFPQHAALIHACTPATDPHVYHPHPPTEAPAYRRERRHEAAHDHREYFDPNSRRAPPGRAAIAGRDVVDTYLADTNDVSDKQPRHRLHQVGSALDYDKAAVPATRGFGCVSCGIERAHSDTVATPPRRADDGLCGDCRDNHQPGVPDHDPTDYIHARCTHIATTHSTTTARALLRKDWQANPSHRAIIEQWVNAHPFTDPDTNVPTDTPATEHSDTGQLHALTDDELAERIRQLELRLALADTETVMYTPSAYEPRSATEDPIRREHAHQAIRDAHYADQQLRDTTQAIHNTAAEIDRTRAELDALPHHQRAQRRQLQERVNTLTTDHDNRTQQRNSARRNARNAHRAARQLAGPEHEWHRIIAGTDEAPTASAHNHEPAHAAEKETHNHDIQHQLDRYRGEQHRRQELPHSEREHDQKPRLSTPKREAAFDPPLQPAEELASRFSDGLDL